jgi:hypothetical protein
VSALRPKIPPIFPKNYLPRVFEFRQPMRKLATNQVVLYETIMWFKESSGLKDPPNGGGLGGETRKCGGRGGAADGKGRS